MREKQVLIIPVDEKYKSRNMGWDEAMNFFKISSSELERIINNGDEIKGAFIDEAIVYDCKIS